MAVNGYNFNVATRGGTNLAHLNVASILGAHKFDMLRKQVEGSGLDVFCASETWLKEDTNSGLLTIKGYNHTRLDRLWRETSQSKEVKKGGGLICYVSNKVVMNDFRYAHLNSSSRDLEMQWVSLEFKNMRKIVIINVYRPPQGDYKNACKSIHNAIKEADLKDNAEIFLMGDFNINLFDKKSPMVRELESTTAFWGLKALISDSTRMGNVQGTLKGSCIDNIFSNSEVISEAQVLDWNFSDHLVVMAKRKRASVERGKVEFKGRSYRNYVKEDLQSALINDNWDDFYNTRDSEQCWNFLENRIRSY